MRGGFFVAHQTLSFCALSCAPCSKRLQMINVLFICSRNQWRSPTGERMFRKTSGVSARSAGTSPRARRTVGVKDIQWADLIFVMEEKHKSRIRAAHPQACRHAKIHVLDIPDEYAFGDPELVELIRTGTQDIIEAAG